MYSKVDVALQEKKGSIKTILWGSWPQLVRRKYNKIHLKWNKTQAGDIAFSPSAKTEPAKSIYTTPVDHCATGDWKNKQTAEEQWGLGGTQEWLYNSWADSCEIMRYIYK